MAENYRMNINRLRPKEGCDLDLFLSGVVSDAVKDCVELGLSVRDAIYILHLVADSFSVDIEVDVDEHWVCCICNQKLKDEEIEIIGNVEHGPICSKCSK